MKKRPHWSWYQWLIVLLISGGTTAFVAPLMAQTAPGTTIRNTFTGTYEDGSGVAQPTAVSNEVTLVISEVAGITVQAQSPSNPGPNPNDDLFVDFVITNVGNDPTKFVLPGQAVLSGAGAASFALNGPLQVLEFNGTDLRGTPVAVPTAGAATNAFPDGGLPDAGVIAPGNTVVVRAPLRVLGIAQRGDTVNVSLGDTATANAQNVAYGDSPGSVYTMDNPGTDNGDTAGAPVNGEREAMDTASPIVVGATFQAFAKVLLAQDYDNGNTPGDISDDRIDYCLAAAVADTAPAGLTEILPSDLNPTALTVDGVTVDRILISDAIPVGMQLSGATPTAPTLGNWDVVYSTNATSTRADQAQWTTTRPTGTVTRIGFVSPQSIQRGETVGGGSDCFGFQVEPDGTFGGGRIDNIAQLFGQSRSGPSLPNTPTQLVYDESGDQTVNNGLVGEAIAARNPDPNTGGAAQNNGGITNGVANVEADGVDPGQGTDPLAANTNLGENSGSLAGTKPEGGETLTRKLAPAPVNGPQNLPGAIGPNSDNDDFTNQVLVPPPGLGPDAPLDDAQTPAVTFINTVRNSSRNPETISLIPTPPSDPAALPDGTTVILTDPATGNNATYRYTAAGGFSFVSGVGATATQPLQLPNVPANGTASYEVQVDLPSAQQLTEYPVPITAFADENGNGLDFDDPANITINRLYTGYIQVLKEARILAADGTELVGFTTDQTLLAPETKLDRIIEYRITYRNLSQEQGSGSDNITLPATGFQLLEDGSANGNTWFELTDDPEFGSNPAAGSGLATIGNLTVTPAGNPTNIQVYTVDVADLQPGQTGTLTFRRQLKQ